MSMLVQFEFIKHGLGVLIEKELFTTKHGNEDLSTLFRFSPMVPVDSTHIKSTQITSKCSLHITSSDKSIAQ